MQKFVNRSKELEALEKQYAATQKSWRLWKNNMRQPALPSSSFTEGGASAKPRSLRSF